MTSNSPGDRLSPGYRRRVLGALMTAQVTAGLASGIPYSMGGLLAAGMAGTAGDGIAATCTTLGAAAFAVPLGRLVVSRGRRFSVITGLLIGTAAPVARFRRPRGSPCRYCSWVSFSSVR
ncbi:hypothetical protein M0E84_09655 [Corynebacterium sp. CCM 9186]|uniref:hypothetical protein n=1 Tax=Corynebacterium meridianum TaxID=2765363 RepID=UPI002004EBA5|nr:hypothetical protein [Corynebacterium meridianum]MCK7678291.1 hypothetical protein [Corynebacterium meridianum]